VKEQLIEPRRVCDNIIDCIDRSDESSCNKYSVIKTNYHELFQICTVNDTNNYDNHTTNGNSGFRCSSNICLDWDIWCNSEKEQSLKADQKLYSVCPGLLENIQNPQLCSNLTFWENKNCNQGTRCRGNLAGQCGYSHRISGSPFIPKCLDKSDFIFEKYKCTNNKTIICENTCIHEDLYCDGHTNCDDESDEKHEVCTICPRDFGYPAGKSKFATMSCRHRYTNKSICAVPCDDIDDLCHDFQDEKNCQISSTHYTILFLSFLIILTIIVGEIVFNFENNHQHKYSDSLLFDESILSILTKYSKNEALKTQEQIIVQFFQMHNEISHCNGIKTFLNIIEEVENKDSIANLAELFFQLECIHHKQNVGDVLICLKNKLGTNETTQWIINQSVGKQSSIAKLLSSCDSWLKELCSNFTPFKLMRHKANKCKNVMIIVKHQLIASGQIISYYLDFIKDTYLVILLFQNVSLKNNFLSFEFQLLLFTVLSICLPQLANILYVIYCTVFKTFRRTSGILMSATFFLIPAVSLYIVNRFNGKREIEKKKNRLSFNKFILKKEITPNQQIYVYRWNLFYSVLKTNEILFENTIQLLLLLLVIFIKFSDSRTVMGLEKLFSGSEIGYIALSAVWSLISTVIGQIKWKTTEKNNFLPAKGKIILMAYFLLSLATRVSSIICFFAPTLGLFGLLNHWKMGSLKTSSAHTEEWIIYDLTENNTVTLLHEKWESMEQYTDLTIWTLESYFKAFLISVVMHYIAVFVVKYIFALKFSVRDSTFGMFYHILNQIMCPTSYKDWDEDINTMEDVRTNWKQVSTELKALLALFAMEHIILCVPIWILSYNIYSRNQFLEEFFPQVQEEQWSTLLAYTLSIVCPIVYLLIIPFLQYGLFFLYHKFGHPWSLIFNAQFEDLNREHEEQDIDETTFDGSTMEDEKNSI